MGRIYDASFNVVRGSGSGQLNLLLFLSFLGRSKDCHDR